MYVFFVDLGRGIGRSAITQMLCEPILNLNYQLIWCPVGAASLRDHVSHYQKGFKLEAGEFRYANYTISN